MKTLLAILLAGLMCLSGCGQKEAAQPSNPAERPGASTPRDRDGIDLRIDPKLPLSMRYELQKSLDHGVPFQRVDLFEAIRKGLVTATAIGGGLQSATIRLELKTKHVLAVDVPGTTYLGSRSGTLQNMVILATTTAWLTPDQPKQDHYVPVACANMPLDAPSGKDDLVIQPLPSKAPKWADLRKLISAPEFADAERIMQQFAVWTITDNPASGDAIKSIQVTFIRPNGISERPTSARPDLDSIRTLFVKVGIDPTRYAVFSKPSDVVKPGQPSAEHRLLARLKQVEESRAEAEAAIYKQAMAAKRTPAETQAMIDAAEGPKRLKEVAAAIKRALNATGDRISGERKAYDEAKAKGTWEDKAVQASEERARPLLKAETEAHAEAEALYKRWGNFLTARLSD